MKTTLVLLICTVSFAGFSQIKTVEPKEVKRDSIKVKPSNNDKPSYYIGAGRNNSFRELMENDAPYGRPLGNRANETKLNVWSYEVGIRSQLNKYLQIDGGLALERFGEQYSATGPTELGDSTYSYQSKYTFISLPIQLYGTVGESFKLYGGGGISPGIVSRFNKEITRLDSLGGTTITETNQPEKLNSFILSARLSGGLQWKWNRNAGIYLNYTYFLGLNSTYGRQDQYKHYARYGCLRFGLIFQLD